MLSVAQLDERIEKCLAILADNPHSQVFAALAEAYRKRGDFGRAFAVCKSGLKHHPDYAPAHLVMAKLYLHQGMYEEAEASLKQAEAADGVTRASEQLEAEILIGMREFGRARTVLDRMRLTDRGNPAIKELAAVLKNAQSVAVTATSTANPAPSPSVEEPLEPATITTEELTLDWVGWASELASRPNVQKVFAIALSDSGTTPFSILAESGPGRNGIDMVSICTGMFVAVDTESRGRQGGAVTELRIECADCEMWCRRRGERLIGFVGQKGFSFGALRQEAMDNAARVNEAGNHE